MYNCVMWYSSIYFFTRTSAQNKYVNKILWKKVFKSQMKTNCQKMLQIRNIGCCTLSPDLLPCFMVMCIFLILRNYKPRLYFTQKKFRN